MATIKSYTDIEQSKKLTEILPPESADMTFLSEESLVPKVNYNGMVFFNSKEENLTNIIPCWSLTALLNVIPSSTLDSSNDHYFRISCNKRTTEWHDNAVDACYEMIIKLNEQKIL